MTKNTKIKKSCHAEFISVSRIFCNKRGAMFGLDARIALAIFGALSIITGAALYGIMQRIKVVSIATEMLEVNKAIEAYYLDTGKNIIADGGTGGYGVQIKYLKEPLGVKGWKGPYIDIPSSPDNSTYGFVSKWFTSDALPYGSYGVDKVDLSKPYNVSSIIGCSSGPNCYYSTRMSIVSESIAFAVDKYVDGSKNGTEGAVRFAEITFGPYIGLYYLMIIGPRVF